MIELKHVSKTFDSDSGGVDALKDVSLTIEDGDIYGIIGMSGAGKSTLVRCINLLEKPTAGEVVVDGQRLDTMTPAQLRAARREITMIFQRFNLLMQRTCLQNVCFPMELSGVKKADAVRRAKELLELVGLPDKGVADGRAGREGQNLLDGEPLPAQFVVPQHHQGFYRTGRNRRTGDHPRMPHDTGAGPGRRTRIRGPVVP